MGDNLTSPKDSGFIRLSRGFFNNFLWAERRAYSKAEAWLDIVAQCPYEPQKRLVAGELVEVPRGGFVASERYFSGRWMWSRTKVRSFLALLEQEKMILKKPQKDHRNTTFLLCNYDKYNPPKDHEQDHWKTSERPVEDQIEEDKNIINKYKTRARTCAYGTQTPTLDEVLSAAHAAGVEKSDAEAFFNAVESRPLTPEGGWTLKDGQPMNMDKWQYAMKAYSNSMTRNKITRNNNHAKHPSKPSKWDNEF